MVAKWARPREDAVLMSPFEARRKALLDRLDRGVALFASAPSTIRNNDVEHEYRQDSDFYYLTGLDEPDCYLILTTAHPEHRSVVFVRPRNPEREQWEGPRVGVDEAPRRYGVDVAFPIDKLSEKLPDYLQNADRLIARLGVSRPFDDRIFRALAQTRARWKSGISWPTEIIDPLAVLHEMRLRKDPHELGLMRQAARITGEGHRRAMAECRPGMFEYELEAAVSHAYRSRGSARHAYPPIVASGPNATVLHYVRNDRRINDGDLVLIDSACEVDGYASDITRTFPANGTFSPEQRAIYEIVLAGQQAAIGACGPGSDLEQIHKKALEVIVDGLLGLKLLSGTRDEVLAEQSHKRFFPHRSSHWLGMDVHDVGRYFVRGQPRLLEPGMVFTLEPGIYVPPSGDQAPAAFRGIGVRIEDDILITQDGCEVLTADVPKTVSDVEAACRG